MNEQRINKQSIQQAVDRIREFYEPILPDIKILLDLTEQNLAKQEFDVDAVKEIIKNTSQKYMNDNSLDTQFQHILAQAICQEFKASERELPSVEEIKDVVFGYFQDSVNPAHMKEVCRLIDKLNRKE